MSKKIVLVIVDGITDKTSFDNILNRLVSNEKIKFALCHGDITQKSKPTYVKEKIKSTVKKFLREPKNKFYEINDIAKIVHIVDIDAVFLQKTKILPTDNGTSYYTECNHFAVDVEQIKKRNDNKKEVLKLLSQTNHITFNNDCIPYEIYYFSCNLEHVLHNKANCTQLEKENLSNSFAKQYLGYEEMFVNFINDEEFSTKLSYIDSWKEIMKPENALKRKTNFNIFINDL